MVAIVNDFNRNALAAKVVSGEISFEKAVTGLTQAEVRIFFRKLDKEYRAKHAKEIHTQNFSARKDETWTLLN